MKNRAEHTKKYAPPPFFLAQKAKIVVFGKKTTEFGIYNPCFLC
jgi:hypothetical protein